MTIPSGLPALISEGRRLIAEATPGPVRAGRSDMISYGTDDDRPYKNIYVGAATARRARNDVPDDLAKVWGVNCIADATLFAFAVNNLPLLLAVAEAAEKVHGYLEEETLYAKGCVGQDEVTGVPCEWHRLLLALDAALRGEVKP